MFKRTNTNRKFRERAHPLFRTFYRKIDLMRGRLARRQREKMGKVRAMVLKSSAKSFNTVSLLLVIKIS